jgi:spore maturation protein CgeB
MSSFRDGLTRLVSEPETRRRLGEQARADVLAKHTWDQNAVRIMERLQLGSSLTAPVTVPSSSHA